MQRSRVRRPLTGGGGRRTAHGPVRHQPQQRLGRGRDGGLPAQADGGEPHRGRVSIPVLRRKLRFDAEECGEAKLRVGGYGDRDRRVQA